MEVETFYNPKMENMPRSEIEKLQLERLKTQIKYVINYSAIEREKLQDAGIKEDSIKTLKDLDKIPTITLEEIRKNITDTRDPYGGTRCIGEGQFCVVFEIFDQAPPKQDPFYLTMTKGDFMNAVEMFTRYFTMIGVRKGDRMLIQGVVDPTDIYPAIINSTSLHLAPSVVEILGSLSLQIGIPMPRLLAAGIDGAKAFNWVKFFKSPVLIVSPEMVNQIAAIGEMEGIKAKDLGVKIIVYPDHKNLLKPSKRRELQAAWNAEVYGMLCNSETALHAVECKEHAGLHVWEDLYLVEAVDSQTGKPAPEGEMGKLTITNLYAQGTPILRYMTDIDVKLDKTFCNCGRTHLRILSQDYQER
ncbi:MAG: phenylacetate--CoA ligase family protein [Candidatus Jordarchaeum sp.]|uniref:phenylacetate--CoA ligase family protein n=1 Tax=Candidatus Jordarchaeum sp. TaxID=2823881 RepID=UPI00404A41FF